MIKKIHLFFDPRRVYIGFEYDSGHHKVWLCLLPTIGISIQFRKG